MTVLPRRTLEDAEIIRSLRALCVLCGDSSGQEKVSHERCEETLAPGNAGLPAVPGEPLGPPGPAARRGARVRPLLRGPLGLEAALLGSHAVHLGQGRGRWPRCPRASWPRAWRTSCGRAAWPSATRSSWCRGRARSCGRSSSARC